MTRRGGEKLPPCLPVVTSPTDSSRLLLRPFMLRLLLPPARSSMSSVYIVAVRFSVRTVFDTRCQLRHSASNTMPVRPQAHRRYRGQPSRATPSKEAVRVPVRAALPVPVTATRHR